MSKHSMGVLVAAGFWLVATVAPACSQELKGHVSTEVITSSAKQEFTRYNNDAVDSLNRHDYEKAEAQLHKAYATAIQSNDKKNEAVALGNLQSLYQMQGRDSDVSKLKLLIKRLGDPFAATTNSATDNQASYLTPPPTPWGGSNIAPATLEMILLQHNFEIEAQMSHDAFQREMAHLTMQDHREDREFKLTAQRVALQAQKDMQLEQLNRQAEQTALAPAYAAATGHHAGFAASQAALSGASGFGSAGGLSGFNVYVQNNAASWQQNNLGPRQPFANHSFRGFDYP